MKRNLNQLCALLIIGIVCVSCNQTSQSESKLSNLKGPYLGQEAPGKTPELFAPGIVSTDALEFGITISKDGKEIYFSRRQSRQHISQLFAYKYKNDQWILEGPLSFTWDGSESEPNLSPDGNKLYFSSRKPLANVSIERGRIWYIEKENGKWTPAKTALEGRGMFATQANNGTLYLTRMEPKIAINSVQMTNNGYAHPVVLPEPINNYLNCAHPYIAPDESYLIYDYNLKPRSGDRNLLISYRVKDKWTKPINITEYLGIKMENSNIPFVSFDGKYFFFCSAGHIYWLDASFIEELRPKS